MCLEYVKCFIAKERRTDLVLARPDFLGKCTGDKGVGGACKGVDALARKVCR